MKKLIAFLTFILCAINIQAKEFSDRADGWNLGIGAGNSTGEYDSEDLGMQDQALRIFGGYQINRWIGYEIQYIQYGEDEVSALDPTAVSASMNLGYSFISGLRPFLLLGIGILDLNDSSGFFQEDVGGSIHYGFGVEYSIPSSKKVSLRLAYEGDRAMVEQCGAFSGCRETNIEFNSFYGGISLKF